MYMVNDGEYATLLISYLFSPLSHRLPSKNWPERLTFIISRFTQEWGHAIIKRQEV